MRTSLLLVAGFLAILALSPPARAGAPAFGQPTISGIQGVGFEQDLRLDPTNPNRLYTSVPGSLSSDTSWIWHSEDAGRTFKWIGAGTAKEGKPNVCAGGGDTELAVDTGGNLYFNDLTLANFSTARSDDKGQGMLCSNTGVPDAAVDRQWYAVDGNPRTGDGLGTGAGHNIYLANDEIGPGGVSCGNSAGNNVLVMYRSPTPAGGGGSAGIEFGPGFKITPIGSCNEGIMGNNEVSPVATTTGQPVVAGGPPAVLGTPVKHVYVVHDDANFSKIFMGRCFPVAFGAPIPNVSDPSGLNCVDLPVADLGDPATVRTGGNFPTMAIDKSGNLYAVWAQAPVTPDGKIGNTSLRFAFSTDEGNHWSAPVAIPTPGLLNSVMPWLGAGDDGRLDIAFYGTSAPVDTVTGGPNKCTTGGPDSVNGSWSLYVVQTLNGHAATPAFSAPVQASEHPIHRGSIQTVLGGQCGNRTLGDFLQLRIGAAGEAQISYSDSNNRDGSFAPHAMYVKQNGGSSVFASKSVQGDPIALNAASDPEGDATRDTDGISSPNSPNLDILQSSMARPDPANCHPAGTPCYRVRMVMSNLSLIPPAPDAVAIWQTQWLVPAAPGCTSPAASCSKGGKNPFVYFESDGVATSCWSGENAAFLVGGGATLTYPGTRQITAPGACNFTLGRFGTISIDVPIADVSLDAGVAPYSSRLYSVTATTLTASAPPDSVQPNPGGVSAFSGPIGGVLFDLIDVVRAYDAEPTATSGGGSCGSESGDGDIEASRGSAAHFHSQESDCDLSKGQEDFSDPSSGTDFHSAQISSVTRDPAGQSMTVAGLGTNNGLPVAFTIVLADSTLAAPGAYSIALSDGTAATGSLLGGSIVLQ